ncbi:MAG: peroxiredoxin [Spirochaetota bacterium]
MLKEGMTAPDFVPDADDGTSVNLSSFAGKTVILYFYPKDDTPGCTKEACGFRDAWGKKSMYGKIYEGVLRSTFVIGKDGVIAKVFPKVKPEGHAEEILALP